MRAVPKKAPYAVPEARNAPGVQSDQVDHLLVEFAPIIKMIAQRLVFRLPPSLDLEDLIHSGVIGFMDALNRYDPSINARFKTYAEFRIRGAMLDEIRALDWVPRSVHDKGRKLRTSYETLLKKNNRPPTEAEWIEALGIDQNTFDVLLYQARSVTLMSLDDLGMKEGAEWRMIEAIADPRSEDPLVELLSSDKRDQLLRAIAILNEKERIVISLYYLEELNMREIGVVLRVSESRVCQLHTRAILKLKTHLSDKNQDKAHKNNKSR